jgi:hypothetical protein
LIGFNICRFTKFAESEFGKIRRFSVKRLLVAFSEEKFERSEEVGGRAFYKFIINNRYMNREETPELPRMHSIVCHYCRHQAIGWPDYKQSLDPAGYACSLDIIKDNVFRPIAPFRFKGDDHSIDGSKGCGKFESSGFPAPPSVIDKMIKNNPLAKSIPIDPDTAEGNFVEKMRKYPHIDNGECTLEKSATAPTKNN